jgi:hypothetical protein
VSRVKVKLKISWLEDVWGSVDITLPFLTLALDGGEWSSSCPYSLPLGKEVSVPIVWEASSV